MKQESCSATTAKGKQCSKRPVHHGLCTMHYNKAHPNAVEPWTEMGLMAPSALNRRLVLNKIRRKLRNTPTNVEAGGSIYIYYLSSDTVENMWKVGMTLRTADVRLAEWQKHHSHTCKVLKKAEYVVKHSVARLERLIHLYLDYCRVYRMPLDDDNGRVRFKSIFSATGEAIENGDEKGSAKSKQIEWFHASILEIKAVIDALIDNVHA